MDVKGKGCAKSNNSRTFDLTLGFCYYLYQKTINEYNDRSLLSNNSDQRF